LQLGTKIGSLLTDGNGDGILVEQVGEKRHFPVDFVRKTSFSLLQGSRMRSTKTEFVSCPSCGRTLFDLQETTARITEATGHLPGVTVAVMGCIVNGPGEMADADFGYVGTLPGKVDLYYGKEVVRKSISNEDAVDALIDLIKEYDMWKDKEEEEAEVVAA
jgi:(E)-4-hydroxy-3-methylbut-2-enyl-diphosphate synthase